MKSYINKLVDYKTAPFKKEIKVSCPEDHVQTQLRHLTRAHKKTVPAETVKKGDVLVLSLESSDAKFNKPAAFVTVGSNLFDSELEAALVGRKAGETFDVSVGTAKVKVTIKQATRTVFPEPTDEMAAEYAGAHDDYEGIKTVDEYIKKVTDEYIEDEKQNAFYAEMEGVIRYVLENSDWEFDDEERSEMIAEEIDFTNKELKEEGKSLGTLSKEDLQMYFGIDDASLLDNEMRAYAETRIASALWTAKEAGLDASKLSIEEIEEKADWSFLEDYLRENITVTEER